MADVKSSGVGVPMVLFIVFTVLKLTKTIDWSWWWVTSPLWISAGLGVVILGAVLAIAYIFDYKL